MKFELQSVNKNGPDGVSVQYAAMPADPMKPTTKGWVGGSISLQGQGITMLDATTTLPEIIDIGPLKK